MQKKIAIASVLKPVNDIRLYEKLGATLADTGDFHIDIIGFRSSVNPKYPNISFYPLFQFQRLHPARLLSGLRLIKLLAKLKPDLLIITTHELLFTASVYKLLYRKAVIYDVCENYQANIAHGTGFNYLIRPILSIFVRFKERLTKPFINYYFLAEQAFLEEMPFMRDRSAVIENKCLYLSSKKEIVRNGNEIKLLFSGTIAREYGIFDAIMFSNTLNQFGYNNNLVIIGRCAHIETLELLKSSVKGHSHIKLMVDSYPIPHQLIIDKMLESDFGLLPYNLAPHLKSRFPTKIYEHLAVKLPIIITNNPEFCKKHNAGISIDFSNYNPSQVIDLLRTTCFFNNTKDEDIYWEAEGKKVISVIKALLLK